MLESSWHDLVLSRGIHAAKLAQSDICHWSTTVLLGVLKTMTAEGDAGRNERCCMVAR